MALSVVDICNRALQRVGSRTNIISLEQDSTEAQNCAMLYESVRDQLLEMAWWNFARKTALLALLKVSPGTPESAPGNPFSSGFSPGFGVGPQADTWIPAYPAPPWLYQYRYPADCLRFRYLIGQGSSDVQIPIFSTNAMTASLGAIPQKFISAIDDRLIANIDAITNSNPCTITALNHFENGQKIVFSGLEGMRELDGEWFLVANRLLFSFTITDLEGNAVDSTEFVPYVSGGYATAEPQRVLLTNAQRAVGTYTVQIVDPTLWTPEFIQALVTALAGHLAIPLAPADGFSGALALKRDLLNQTNMSVVQARLNDANEGFTVQGTTPDWILARGAGDTLDSFNECGWIAPYPPLFAVS